MGSGNVCDIILYLVLHAWEVAMYNQYKSTFFQRSAVNRKQWRADAARITNIERLHTQSTHHQRVSHNLPSSYVSQVITATI